MTTPWDLFAPHRARVTGLLLEAPVGTGSLCLLGAGRCRDVDLTAAARRFREIHLVDIEAMAIAAARARLPADVQRRVHLHGGIDLSGAREELARWRDAPPALPAQADALAARVLAHLPATDVVASICLLSQLCWYVGHVLGPEHAAATEIRSVVLAAHLRVLVGAARPGGTALLVHDVAVAPRGDLEARLLARGPAALLASLDPAQAPFGAVPAAVVESVVARDPVLVQQTAHAQPLEPWLWTRTEALTYLCYGLRLARRPSPSLR